MDNIKCLKWISNDNIILDKRVPPSLKENEALLRVESCGICGSDLKIKKFGNRRVKKGQIIGHEISGQIVEVNGNTFGFNLNDKISLGADVPYDGKKDYAIGHEIEGGFSQFMVVNEHTLKFGPIKKFENIDYDIASLAEPLACCINGFEKVSFNDYNSVLIMGSGPIGVMLSFLAHDLGIKTILMTDISDERLENLNNFSFITNCVNTKKVEIKSWIKKNTDNKGIDLIFTANNNISSQIDAIGLVRNKTVINFFGGLPSNSDSVQINTNQLHYDEAVLTGSHGSTPKQHSLALDLIKNNQSFFKKIISKTFSINDFEEAYRMASDSKALKVIIKPNQ
tara:strand:+ start:17 stop:1033 length:1017 start_codon:yes stop_codon:yes gene_type:complete